MVLPGAPDDLVVNVRDVLDEEDVVVEVVAQYPKQNAEEMNQKCGSVPGQFLRNCSLQIQIF